MVDRVAVWRRSRSRACQAWDAVEGGAQSRCRRVTFAMMSTLLSRGRATANLSRSWRLRGQ